jgi:hypothetical protein
LPHKDLREMVVLGAVCVISTIVFVPPLVGVTRPAAPLAAIASRDLRTEVPLLPVRLHAASFRPATASRVTTTAAPVQLARRDASRDGDERPLAAKLGRAITGSGRHRLQPFPRPSEFK